MSDPKADIKKEKAAVSVENKRLVPSNKNPNKGFSKKRENFVCGKCGNTVKGNGYTNHCPVCLYSKHVDIKPGDRLANCGGLMKPVRVEGTEKEYRVLHRCVACKYEKINKVSPEDRIEALVAIIKENSATILNSYSKGK